MQKSGPKDIIIGPLYAIGFTLAMTFMSPVVAAGVLLVTIIFTSWFAGERVAIMFWALLLAGGAKGIGYYAGLSPEETFGLGFVAATLVGFIGQSRDKIFRRYGMDPIRKRIPSDFKDVYLGPLYSLTTTLVPLQVRTWWLAAVLLCCVFILTHMFARGREWIMWRASAIGAAAWALIYIAQIGSPGLYSPIALAAALAAWLGHSRDQALLKEESWWPK